MSAKKRRRQTTSQHPATPEADVPYQVRVKVFGVGGGGGNAISRMSTHLNQRAIELIAINTDMQDLQKCQVRHKIHVGKNLTRGLGTGMNPELGRQAAEENRSEIVEAVKGADLIFITAGLGGGTGSGGAPVVAEIAKEHGALTVAIVTKPFTFEGSQRSRVAEEALLRLRERVDALIVVPNDRVFSVIKKDTPVIRAFEKIDEILRDAISGITELIAATGIINVDFSDVRTIIKEAGAALIGVGTASGEKRAVEAAMQALNSPLLEFSVEGARGVLFGVSGGRDMKMTEINDIAKAITATIDPSAKIIFGAYQDRKLKQGSIKVTLIATGFTGTVNRGAPDLGNMASLFDAEPIKITKEADQSKAGMQNPVKDRVEKEREREKDVKQLLKKPVEANRVDTREERREFKLPGNSSQPPMGAKPSGAPPAPAAPTSSSLSDIWEIPAFLRKKRRDN